MAARARRPLFSSILLGAIGWRTVTDYSTWEEEQDSVVTLQLDPQNPRIPGGERMTQGELIAELVAHDKVYELAKDIANDGFYPLESLLAIEEDGKTYVVEGNRRLTALKLLISPEAAPESHAKKFRALAERLEGPISTVRVLLAPSREDAAPLIMQKHTRSQVERWNPLMQARFYRSLAANGLSVGDLAAKYGITLGEIAEFLRLDEMYEAACALELDTDVKTLVHNPREFPSAILKRLIDAPKFREYLGVEFEDDGTLRGRVSVDEFRKGYKRVLTDIARKKVDTRIINKAEDIQKYLADISGDEPNKKKKGNFKLGDLQKGRTAKTPAEVSPPPEMPKATRTKRERNVIVPSGTKCRNSEVRIRTVFDELKRLKLDAFPNSVAVMLRTLLELGIANYLDKTKKIQPVLAKYRAKGKPNDWYPSLRQLLTAMKDDPSIEIGPQQRKQLTKLVSDENSLIDHLDQFVHNRFAVPSSVELIQAWNTLSDILEVILDEPPASSNK